MQFDNQKTRNVADVAARIMAGESVQKKPQQLDEKLHPNQQVLDVHEPEKDELTAKDFEMLRKKKKMKKEEVELEESHFKVGDKVKCKTSGMKGEVVKMDKEDGDEDEKYYTVKREDGTMKKMAPEDMTKINEASEKEEEAEQIDEVMFPGSKEYEKKYGQSPQQKLKKKGDTVPTSQGTMSKTDKGVAHRRRFTEMLESYTEGGLKYIASLVKEEPDNEQYTKEVEKAKAKDRGEDRNDKGVAKPFQSASVREEPVNPVREEVEQVDEVLDSAGKFMSYATKAAASGLKSAVMGTGKYRKRQAGIQKAVEKAKAKVNEEVEELDEREMTDAEMKKREEIVKSMKKGLSGFKQRYGDRAKDVMYATATKQAMKD